MTGQLLSLCRGNVPLSRSTHEFNQFGQYVLLILLDVKCFDGFTMELDDYNDGGLTLSVFFIRV